MPPVHNGIPALRSLWGSPPSPSPWICDALVLYQVVCFMCFWGMQTHTKPLLQPHTHRHGMSCYGMESIALALDGGWSDIVPWSNHSLNIFCLCGFVLCNRTKKKLPSVFSWIMNIQRAIGDCCSNVHSFNNSNPPIQQTDTNTFVNCKRLHTILW